MEEKDIDLFDYLQIIWKRKWMIIIGVVMCGVIAIAVSFIFPAIYEIDAIIQPGKFLSENEMGNLEEVVLVEPQQLADMVNHESFNALIAAELGIGEKELPEIKAEHINDTLLTRIWITDANINLSKRILNSMIRFVRINMDEKIEIEINNIDSIIQENEIGKQRSEKQIEIYKTMLRIIADRKAYLRDEMKSVRTKVDELEKFQLDALKNGNKTELETLTLLLYSNEIQQSLRFYDLLNEKLKNENLEEEKVHSDTQLELAEIQKFNNEIANQTERKGRIDKTNIVKEPTSSVEPVFPKTALNIFVAIVIGFVIFVLMAFILETYIIRMKKEEV